MPAALQELQFEEVTKRLALFRQHSFGTLSGLSVDARLLDGPYPKGVKITAKQVASLPITHHDTLPKWNYALPPEAEA